MKKIKEKKSQKHTNQGDRNTLLGREAKRQRSTKPDWQKETEKQTERQTDRQAGRQAGMQTDRQTDKQTDRQSYLSFKNLLKRYLPSRTFACFPFKICSWETHSYYVSQRSLSVLNLSKDKIYFGKVLQDSKRSAYWKLYTVYRLPYKTKDVKRCKLKKTLKKSMFEGM